MNTLAGSVLPIKRAEELILTLPGVVSAKIIESESGAVEQIHVLTTAELDSEAGGKEYRERADGAPGNAG